MIDKDQPSTTSETDDSSKKNEAHQEKSDPQETELKGFIDPKEDLEPTLQDGTKSPDKKADNSSD